MNDYDEELAAFEEDAEGRYDDFDGEEYYEEDEFDEGFEGMEDDYDDEYEEVEYIPEMEEDDDYDSYQRSSIGRIDPNDRTLTIVVKNEGDQDKEAIIFGAFEGKEQSEGITVIVEESSHNEVREESKSNPFKIAGMKMSVSNPLQFDNVFRITNRTAAGTHTSQVYQPRNATSPQNNDKGMIDDDNFEMNVTGRDSLRVVTKKGITVVFTMTIKARANMANLLKGENVAEMSSVPRTTGLPQLDLIRKRRPSAFGLNSGVKRGVRKVKRMVRRLPAPPRPRFKRKRKSNRRFLRRRR